MWRVGHTLKRVAGETSCCFGRRLVPNYIDITSAGFELPSVNRHHVKTAYRVRARVAPWYCVHIFKKATVVDLQ